MDLKLDVEATAVVAKAVILDTVKQHPYATAAGVIIVGGFLLKKAVSFAVTTTASTRVPPRATELQDADVIIVGCGVGGAALAVALARDGRKVLCIERSMSEPDRIVGELMQPGGVQALHTLGLSSSIDNIDARTVHGYIVHSNGRQVTLPYPSDDKSTQPTGSSFVHGKFVQGLRALVKNEKNITVIEGAVGDVIEENGAIRGVQYACKGADDDVIARAPLTFLMDGLNSKFRKRMSSTELKARSYFCGCIVEGCQAIDDRFAEVILTPRAPVLVYPIAPNRRRILVDIPAPLPSVASGALKEYFISNILPHVPKHVQGPLLHTLDTATDDSDMRLRAMQCCFLPPAPICQPGAILLGDAFNMRHPLTGGGMSVVLNDIILLRNMLREIPDLSDTKAVVAMTAEFNWKRKANHASATNILAMALSELFAGNSVNLEYLRTACFEYFEGGPSCTDGPVRLLGVINPDPKVLVYHFFSVGVRAAALVLRAYPWYMTFPFAILRSISVLFTATRVIVPLIRSELYRPRIVDYLV